MYKDSWSYLAAVSCVTARNQIRIAPFTVSCFSAVRYDQCACVCVCVCVCVWGDSRQFDDVCFTEILSREQRVWIGDWQNEWMIDRNGRPRLILFFTVNLDSRSYWNSIGRYSIIDILVENRNTWISLCRLVLMLVSRSRAFVPCCKSFWAVWLFVRSFVCLFYSSPWKPTSFISLVNFKSFIFHCCVNFMFVKTWQALHIC